MPLPVDTDSYDYKFNRTLNEDVKLVSNIYGRFDLAMDNGDYINVTGHDSLKNAIIIAIMTRYNELKTNPLYPNFGCKVHDVIKGNKSNLLLFKIETSILESLNKMRRVKTVDWLEIIENDRYSYEVKFTVTSINDVVVKGSVML